MHAAHWITRLMSDFFLFIFFAHLLTHWDSVSSRNACRVQIIQLLIPDNIVCYKRSSTLSFETWLWPLSRVIFYVMESALVRSML